MKYGPVLFACGVFALAGCGQRLPENVNPDDAGPLLRTALDAWKDGKASDDLKAHEPPIIMNESDWGPGGRLLEYQMDEAGSMDGRQVRWVVKIKFQDKGGKVSERKATYIIDTIPRVVIVRDSFAT